MSALLSNHASTRVKQRGIPQLIMNWLIDYGAEQFDGHGGAIRYFDKSCLRKMERELGQEPLRRLSEYLRCYLVQSSMSGLIITVGKRYERRRVHRH